MSKSLNALFTTLLLTTSGAAVAASSVDLTVKGLITPSACEPSLPNGGHVDIGKISAKDLKADDHTNLGEHTLPFTVTCDAATLMAIEPNDNRAGSSTDPVPSRFGLGLINSTEKLGFLEVWLSAPSADGTAGRMIGSVDGGTTWTRESNLATGGILSVADNTTLAPVPVKLFTADMTVSASIAPASGLTLTQEVPIDGSVTLTVKYL